MARSQLRFQNVPDDCDLELDLPELRKCTIHYLCRDDQVLLLLLYYSRPRVE